MNNIAFNFPLIQVTAKILEVGSLCSSLFSKLPTMRANIVEKTQMNLECNNSRSLPSFILLYRDFSYFYFCTEKFTLSYCILKRHFYSASIILYTCFCLNDFYKVELYALKKLKHQD